MKIGYHPRRAATAQTDELQRRLEAEIARLRAETAPPGDAVPEGALGALQARLARLHTAGLLADEEVRRTPCRPRVWADFSPP